MFIKLNFISYLPGPDTVRIIRISRIQEVRPSHFHDDQCEIQLSGNKEFLRVRESIDDVFGTIAPAKKNQTGADILENFIDAKVGRVTTLNNPFCRAHNTPDCSICDI